MSSPEATQKTPKRKKSLHFVRIVHTYEPIKTDWKAEVAILLGEGGGVM
jgi:hypothetical protein